MNRETNYKSANVEPMTINIPQQDIYFFIDHSKFFYDQQQVLHFLLKSRIAKILNSKEN